MKFLHLADLHIGKRVNEFSIAGRSKVHITGHPPPGGRRQAYWYSDRRRYRR